MLELDQCRRGVRAGHIEVTQEGCPHHRVWIQVAGEAAMSLLEFGRRRYGMIQALDAKDRSVRKALQLVRLVKAEPQTSVYRLSALTYEWMMLWLEDVARRTVPLSQLVRQPPNASRLVSLAPRTVKDLAAEMGYSRSYLTERLSSYWQQPPGRALRTAKLEEAARLLRTTDLSVSEIGERVGYGHKTSFSRAFQWHFSRSPLAYRHQAR